MGHLASASRRRGRSPHPGNGGAGPGGGRQKKWFAGGKTGKLVRPEGSPGVPGQCWQEPVVTSEVVEAGGAGRRKLAAVRDGPGVGGEVPTAGRPVRAG